ncbi:MAG: efflux RND transporter periplasmic adaptor subunit [Bacteroidetes bacterium]|nr:MAG: efflux RND transporter periplasmic adaptor subunit [Bacteroidota bacterium]REK06649.1 MAG: efflux RND transporter periplasmic adaptor subunit [Bacteroidota bacterium]REK33415.1 MAG: efflux RND transporter periplasmic adaptor subunit [Bacteroidota bacterium]REK49814.1 MAG: efflux RND transporter periplasmic adaptor subunit [Bacteroidota bacterium]
MKNRIFFYSLIAVAYSCSSGQNNVDKQAKLQELRKQQSELKQQITELETELANSDTTLEARAKNVVVTEMKTAPFLHFIEVQAKVEGDEDVIVSAESMGTLMKVNARPGDKVSKGQLLASTDDRIIMQSIAEVQTQLDLATHLYHKQQNLWTQKIGSEVQYLQAKTNKESLEKRMATLREQLDMTRIKSPINGTVDQVYIKTGQTVAPGMPAFRVVNTNSLKVTAEVAESFISKVNKGNEVIISFPDMNKEIRSKLDYAGRAINPMNRTFNVEVRLNEKDGNYLPNMVAVLRIVDYENEKAFVVPVGSIQKSKEGEFLYVAGTENGKTVALRKSVISGMTYNGYTEITGGLEEGDRVITFGYQNVIEGDIIKL